MTTKEIKKIINRIEANSSKFRLPVQEKLDLLDWASDSPKNVKIPESTYAKLNIKSTKAKVKHYPILSTILERYVGTTSKALSKFSVLSFNEEKMNFKNTEKDSKLDELIQKLLDTKDEKLYEFFLEEINTLVNKEFNLDEEIFASNVLQQASRYMDTNFELDKGRYWVKTLGEYFMTVDILPDSLLPRMCNPLHVLFEDSENPFDISTSDGIVEHLFWSLQTVVDRFNLDKKVVDKLKKDQGTSFTDVKSQTDRSPSAVTYEVAVDTLDGIHLVGSTGSNNLIDITKTTYKFLRERKKVFESVVDIEEKKFKLKSKDYKEKPHEKVEIIYETVWKVFYFVESIEELLFEKEIHLSNRKLNKSDNRNSLYSGYVKTLNYKTPFSEIKNILPFVLERDALYNQLDKLIADNLGVILALEPKTIPKGIKYNDWLRSLVNNGIVHFDSTQRIGKGAISQLIGETVKSPIYPVNLDTSANARAAFDLISRIEDNIFSVQGASRESTGDIQQNARVENVKMAAQQSSHVQFSTNKLVYLAQGQMYQNIVDVMQVMNTRQSLNTLALLNNQADTPNLNIPEGLLTDAQLSVEISPSLEELIKIQDAKDKAADMSHQKAISASEYYQILDSSSLHEILDIFEKSEQRQLEQQQQQQQAQQEQIQQLEAQKAQLEDAKAQKEHEREMELQRLKNEGKIEDTRVRAANKIPIKPNA